MFHVSSFTAIQDYLSLQYGDSPRPVGIMLANYKVPFVQEIIRYCYHSWDLETGHDFQIFWPGYLSLSAIDRPHPRNTFLVNFNSQRSAESDLSLFLDSSASPLDPHRLSLLRQRNNENKICFHEPLYIQGKKDIRQQLGLSPTQKLDSMTLVIAPYKEGTLFLHNKSSIIVNLRELSNREETDSIALISEVMSEINTHCTTEGDFVKLKKKIAKTTKEHPSTNWKSTLSLLLEILSFFK